jgi:hypothetical protein
MPASLTSGAFYGTSRHKPSVLASAGRAVWRFLLQMGAHRAAPHLNALAAQYDRSNPELARQLRAHVRNDMLN